jgi:hypothetical protein
MTDTIDPPTPNTETPGPPSKKRSRKWMRWAVPVAAFVVGTALGFAAAGGDPRESEEYRALQGELSAAQERIGTLEDEVRSAQNDARKAAQTAEDTIRDAEETLLAKAAELDEREADVAAREKAADELFNRVAETSIEHGVWTVGVDVEPGTYRTAEALTGYCYWAIYRSGTNGDDIIQNDGPEGGYPTVTLSEGQDFENSGCGTFIKQ